MQFGCASPKLFGCASPKLPSQWLDEVQDVAVQISNSELARIVEGVVDVFDEVDTVRGAGGGCLDLTLLQKLVQIVDLVGIEP